jgi:dTMP kinase
MSVSVLKTGLFITLEGSEGVGKTTQLSTLAEYFTSEGREVITTREPGGTEGAESIRNLLLQGDAERWGNTTEALLFAAARADHVSKLIRPALARGAVVLCDRFIDSTRAYQGGAGGLADADIMQLHRIGSGGILPHRTLLLDMPIAVAQERAMDRDKSQLDRMGSKQEEYYEQVKSAFLTMAISDARRFRIIDASASLHTVNKQCIAAVSDLLN